MSYFKLLSEDPSDYIEDCDSYDIQQTENKDYLELTLDTGEQFCVPVEWLINAARQANFSSLRSYNGFIH